MAILLYSSGTGAIGTDVLAYDENLQGFVDGFTLPTTDGTNGQVLTTNGAGVTSFADILFSGQIVNGVAIFHEPVAPANRKNRNGNNIGPLVAGDLWYNPNTEILGAWTSPYWLSQPVELPVISNAGFLASGTTTYNFVVPYNIFVHSVELRYANSTGTPTDGSNFFSGTINLRDWNNAGLNYLSIPFNNNSTAFRSVHAVNAAYVPDLVTSTSFNRLGLSLVAALTETGTSYFVLSALIRYSLIL